jgi:hypothetical protein
MYTYNGIRIFANVFNSIPQSQFGKGSSFQKSNKDYLNSYNSYITDTNMIELLNDAKIKENWNRINKIYDNFLSE